MKHCLPTCISHPHSIPLSSWASPSPSHNHPASTPSTGLKTTTPVSNALASSSLTFSKPGNNTTASLAPFPPPLLLLQIHWKVLGWLNSNTPVAAPTFMMPIRLSRREEKLSLDRAHGSKVRHSLSASAAMCVSRVRVYVGSSAGLGRR
jgi:hypothetical protein